MINWFPGHMAKTMRLIEDNIKIVDAVIYVLDSRAISACINPSFTDIIKNKPILYVLNKADTVDFNDLTKWCKYFDQMGYNYVTSNSANGNDSKKILNKLQNIMQNKINRYRQKGVNTPVRAMVIGIPNSGKSTLINSLCRGKKTVTGDKPGVTRSKQWLAVSKGIDLLDTPGTLCPKLDDQKLAYDLAYIGSISDDAIDIYDVSLNLLGFLKENYPNELQKRYNLVSINLENNDIFEEIAKKRGNIVRGGDIDTERNSRVILDDFRKQKFGNIMLEKIND